MKILVLTQDRTPIEAHSIPEASSSSDIERLASAAKERRVKILKEAYRVLNPPWESADSPAATKNLGIADQDAIPTVDVVVVELEEAPRTKNHAPKVVVLSLRDVPLAAYSPPDLNKWKVEKFASSVKDKKIEDLKRAYVVLHPDVRNRRLVEPNLPPVNTTVVDLFATFDELDDTSRGGLHDQEDPT